MIALPHPPGSFPLSSASLEANGQRDQGFSASWEVPFNPERIQAALTSLYHEFVFLTPLTTPRTLVTALSEHLPHIDPVLWPSLLARGGTYVNGTITVSEIPLPCPCRIEFYEPRDVEASRFDAFSKDVKRYVVHEDEDLLVVYKPRGISSMPTREQRSLNLKTFLEAYLAQSSPGSSLHMPSRVDTSVEGLVVTSKNVRTHAALQRVYERRMIRKVYALRTDRAIPWESLEASRSIDRHPLHPILRTTVASGGKPALTRFIRISTSADGSTIAALPVTGRTHQIRLHAAAYGFPILGDNFYSGSPAPALHLVSALASFQHPRSKTQVTLCAPHDLRPPWIGESFFSKLDEAILNVSRSSLRSS